MSPRYMCIDKEYLGKRLRMKFNYEVPTMCALGLTVSAIELELKFNYHVPMIHVYR